jgi:predicted N-acyltransferase
MSSSALIVPVDAAASPGAYRLEIAERVADLNPADWDSLRTPKDCGFMDRRFVEAVEASRPGGGKFWSLLVYSGDRPVASACLSLFAADAAIVATGWAKRLTDRIRRIFPHYLRFNVLFCGLPVSAGQRHLLFSADADRPQVTRLIDAQMRALAKQHRAKILIFKELDEQAYVDAAELKSLGYIGVQSSAVSFLDCSFANYDDYLNAMRSRYRKNVVSSQRKFAAAGFRVETLAGGEAVADRFNGDVHRLYEAVLERSKSKLEALPAEFFREIARRFPTDFMLILAHRGERVVGFSCGIRTRGAAATLFLGVDYEFNDQGDIYFNLIYAYLREILSDGVHRVDFGAGSDDFKARLGCRQRTNYMFVGATKWLRWPLRWFAPVLFPPVKLLEPLHVFGYVNAELSGSVPLSPSESGFPEP